MTFPVTNNDIDRMIHTLTQENFELKDEIKQLSRSWIAAVMGQSPKNDQTHPRSFDYSKKNIYEVLKWRQENGLLVSEIQGRIDTDSDPKQGGKYVHNLGFGCLYWYGSDVNGCPNLWLREDIMGWKNLNYERRMECTGLIAGLILQSAINAMPPHVHYLNFILLLDKFNPIDTVHHPGLGPAFLNICMKCCSDRLKEAVMVTRTSDRVFYNITKSFAPKSLVDKIKVIKSRSATGRYLIEKGIVGIDHRSLPLSSRSSSLSPSSPLSSSPSFLSSSPLLPSSLALISPSSTADRSTENSIPIESYLEREVDYCIVRMSASRSFSVIMTEDSKRPDNMSGRSTSMLDSWKSYISDVPMVAELIFCILLAASGHFIPGKIFRISLHERDVPYQLTDNDDIILSGYINNPYVVEETIPDWLLVVLAVLVPLIIVLFTGLMSSIENDLHSSLCALLFTIGSTEIISNSIKLYCGYLRPMFYEYCEFDTDSLQCLSDERNDPRKSFPSGHSCLSLCSASILTLLFLGRVGTHRIDDDIETNVVFALRYIKKRCLSILATFPMLLGIFIAVSRVHDNRHHPADIVAGSMIGIGCAIFSYHLWYPSVYSSRSGIPVQAK